MDQRTGSWRSIRSTRSVLSYQSNNALRGRPRDGDLPPVVVALAVTAAAVRTAAWWLRSRRATPP